MNIHPKIQSAGIAGALTILLVYVLGLLNVEVPAEVASAITTVFSFAAGYMKTM